MKFFCKAILCIASVPAFAHEAEVVVTYASGRIDARRMPLVEKSKGVLEWRLSRADLAPEANGPVREVRVTPDFARAAYGEEGWYMAGDGQRGFFRPRTASARKLWEASYQIVPVYGMKTPRATFLALATGMRYHAGVDYVASNGFYTVSLTFHEDMYEIYEDLACEYHFFDAPGADYNEMAHCYRDYQKAQARLVPLKDRAAKQPALAYAAKWPEVRVRQAWKPVPAPVNRQVPENEPKVTPYVTFARVAELARRVKASGVGGAEFCLVGWNKGGHDGAYPQLFPVEPTLGGEAGLRQCVADVQDLGYAIVAHGNYNDAYMIADSFDLEFVKEKDANGFVVRPKTTWGGGGKFTMCPQRAYEKFAIRDAARVDALGFKGLYYLDVVTCHVPPACRDPRHPLTRVIEDTARIFARLGFSVADGPELETRFNNFTALNTPPHHPSQDRTDTFWFGDDCLLRTQTSPVQIRTMLANKPPVRVICPGRTFRRDTTDATHSANFHQIEGLYVDEKPVSLADLKSVLAYFANAMMGDGVKVRFRPHFFPFTEPSVEVDFSCHVCKGAGCRVCKDSGWIEVAGAGMVDPRVFRHVGYDPEKVSGYAFGFGVERIAMIKYGIPDIRWLYENDARFLSQLG